jgi:hypothetical protein
MTRLTCGLLLFIAALVGCSRQPLQSRPDVSPTDVVARDRPSDRAAIPEMGWAVSGGGADDDFGLGLAIAPAQVLLVGQFAASALFGTHAVSSMPPASQNAFLARASSAGTFLSAVAYGSAYVAKAVTTDSSANAWVVGGYSGTAQFGSIASTAVGQRDAFILRTDLSGSSTWVAGIGGADDDYATDVAVDSYGNAYVVGVFRESLKLGSALHVAKGEADIFITKLSPDGSIQWLTSAGGPDFDAPNAVAVDSVGNTYVTGFVRGNAEFGSIHLSALAEGEIFLAKLNPGGTFVWVASAGGLSAGGGDDVQVAPSGEIVVVGTFAGTAIFGNTVLKSSGIYTFFVARFAADASPVSAIAAGDRASAASIAFDPQGNVVVTGCYRDTITLGTKTLSGGPGDNVFVATLAHDNAWLWAMSTSATALSGGCGTSLAIDDAGHTYVAGFFHGVVAFQSTTLTSIGQNDVFLWKIGL